MFNKPIVRNFKTSNNVASLPFEELAEATPKTYDAEVEAFVNKYGLKSKLWVYPQLIAEVAKWTLKRNGSKICGKEFVKTNCVNARNKGIYWFLMWDKRALEKQYKFAQYSAITPLIMSAFKTMHNLKYSEWDEVQYVINPSLLEAISIEIPDYSLEELLSFREKGLTAQTGRSAGSTKSAQTTYGVYAMDKELEDGRSGLGSMPQLARMIILQTWCAHPSNRSPYCILDIKDWDNMPEPLISADVMESTSKLKFEMPW